MKTMLRRHARSEDAVVFSFALNGAHDAENPVWEEEDEFSLNGKMYDVIDKRVESGKLIVRCVSDEKETALIDKYQEILEKEFGGSAKKQSASLIKLISAPFTIPPTFVSNAMVFLLHNQYPVFHCSIPVSCRDVNTPPPRFL